MVLEGTERLHEAESFICRLVKTARNTLTQRVQGPSSEATVEIDVSGLKDGNVAGFGIFEFPYAYVGVEQSEGIKES